MNIRNKFINNQNHNKTNNAPRITMKFLGLTIRIPRLSILLDRRKNINYYHSFKSAAEIPKATGNLRLIQKANANLLKDFDAICAEYNLKYWLDFGTLLGAMRHKGFIPWDDDVDVSMPRDDYERLTSEFKNGFPKHPDFELVIGTNKKNKRLVKFKHKHIPKIGVDIFPYDYYHSELTEKEKKDLSLKITKCMKPKLFTKFETDDAQRANFKEITDKIILKGKTGKPENKPAIFMAVDFPHKWKNKVFDWENVFPLQKIEYEGENFNAPNNADKFLRNIYGNYMEIPEDSYPRHTSYLYLPDDQVNLLKEYAGYITEKDNCKKNSIENPKVSVIIPVYNVEKYLHKCLDSILRQTLKEIEIICIDDGSQDNSLEVIKEYASKDNRIIVISQENKKQGAARNRGIEIAKGEYLAFIDSDDCVELDYFEKLYSLVKSYNADIVTTNILKHKKKYSKYNVLYKKEASATSLNDKINLCKDKSQRFFNVVNKLYKKSLINDNNIRFAENCYFEDVMFSTKTIYSANKIVSCSNTTYHYIEHSTSTVKSKDNIAKKRDDHIIAYKELQDFAQEKGFNLPERLNFFERYWKNPFIMVYKGKYVEKYTLLKIITIYKKQV